MRKLKKTELDQIQKRSGVRVEYNEKPNTEEKQVTLTLPDGMLDPLMKALSQMIESQQQTQNIITEALTRLDMKPDSMDIRVTERDEFGNISKLSLGKETRH